jgi:hypothetical protein
MSTIEKRIVAALSSDATSADVATMIAEVDAALLTAVDAAERERVRAYDPTVDAEKARQSLADAQFARDRLRAASAALQRRLQELQAKEYSVRWHGEYEQIEAKCCALAEEVREIYPAVQSKIVDLLSRVKACDAEVGRINGSAPDGVRLRLHEVELVARNLEGFTRDEPSITNELRLPDWDQPRRLAWPPPRTPLGVLASQDLAAAVDHPGDNWWQRRDERLGKL